MTRATRLALHGDFAAATHMHPLWFVIMPAAIVAFAVETRGYVRDGRLGAVERSRHAGVVTGVLAVLLITVWLARFFGAFGGPVPV